jgi:hypothetical protein
VKKETTPDGLIPMTCWNDEFNADVAKYNKDIYDKLTDENVKREVNKSADPDAQNKIIFETRRRHGLDVNDIAITDTSWLDEQKERGSASVATRTRKTVKKEKGTGSVSPKKSNKKKRKSCNDKESPKGKTNTEESESASFSSDKRAKRTSGRKKSLPIDFLHQRSKMNNRDVIVNPGANIIIRLQDNFYQRSQPVPVIHY